MKRRIWRLFPLLALLLLPIARADASELFGKITYKGTPLKGTEVSVGGKTVKTNDIGFYSVNLDPGAYVLGVKLPDGSVKEQKVDVFPQDTEKNLKME